MSVEREVFICPKCGQRTTTDHECIVLKESESESKQSRQEMFEPKRISTERKSEEEAEKKLAQELSEKLKMVEPVIKTKIDKRLLGDFEPSSIEINRIKLSETEIKALNLEAEKFFEEIKKSPLATNKGYKVAGLYDTKIQGWTTRSKIFFVEGKRVFALCSYPNAWLRRKFDRFMEWISGDPMRKPKPGSWKKLIESRSNIPVLADTPANMVVMPYIESFNAYDLFAHQRDIDDFGPFKWAQEMSLEQKIDLLDDIAAELAKLHAGGKTWGEAILPNIVLDQEKKPLFVDPETTYEGISIKQQKAVDIRNLITSVCGALARADDFKDFRSIIKRILTSYGDNDTIQELGRLCKNKLPFRQRLFFNLFTRFRNGSTDLHEFEKVRKIILEVIHEE